MCSLRVFFGAAPTRALFHACHQNTASGSAVFLIKQVTLQGNQQGTVALFQVFKELKKSNGTDLQKYFEFPWAKAW